MKEECTDCKENLESRIEAAFNLPGQPNLSPKKEEELAVEDATALSNLAKAQEALNKKVQAETGEETKSFISAKIK
jgi:hypothetical protein